MVRDMGKMAFVLLFGDHRRLWDELVHFVDLVGVCIGRWTIWIVAVVDLC